DFFPEWCENLPPLTDAERASLDLIRRRFIYHRQDGDLTEGTVTLLMGSPLLEMTGFYDHPFKMRGEASIELVLDQDDEEVEPLRGRIDILTVQNRFWVVILESKRTTISATTALPQTLAYMMANPHPQQPIFGMVTNGDDIFFVKLVQTGIPQYAISRTFSPFASSRELYNAAQVLKNVSRMIG
ncbi:MAG: type I restriction endonuclease subunit R, partial [Phormidesmis sp. CAN_BIN44]|nr:type I restriction endonuclease subunit R [Phormidesmis sp. CAN_BIN44]